MFYYVVNIPAISSSVTDSTVNPQATGFPSLKYTG